MVVENSPSVDADAALSDEARELLAAHWRPSPRVDLVPAMVESGVQCAMDVSDGLLLDLERICSASGVDAVLDAGRVPIAPALRSEFPDRAQELALTGGEDYELVYIADAATIAKVNAAQPTSRDSDYGVVGEITPRRGSESAVRVLDETGDEIKFDAKGWDHFAR